MAKMISQQLWLPALGLSTANHGMGEGLLGALPLPAEPLVRDRFWAREGHCFRLCTQQ